MEEADAQGRVVEREGEGEGWALCCDDNAGQCGKPSEEGQAIAFARIDREQWPSMSGSRNSPHHTAHLIKLAPHDMHIRCNRPEIVIRLPITHVAGA